jgi:hypothetical protein
MLKGRFFLLGCLALITNTSHFDKDIVKLDLSVPRWDRQRKTPRLTKKQRKARAKEFRAKQARKINYKNQKSGIINPSKYNNYGSNKNHNHKDRKF